MSEDITQTGWYQEMTNADLHSVNQRLTEIEVQLTSVRKTMDETEAMVRKLIAEVGPVIQEIIPMINGFLDNPMVKMAFRGKK